MSTVVIVAIAVVAVLAGVAIGFWMPPHGRRPALAGSGLPARRILLPFTGEALSQRALEAAFRLARAEGATLMPAYLARVPRAIPLDAPLPRQAERAVPVLEAIEQRAARRDIATDCRVARGRTCRDALRRLLDEEQIDRIVVAARRNGDPGFAEEDVTWMLRDAPVEVVVLRAGPDDHRKLTAEAVRGHF